MDVYHYLYLSRFTGRIGDTGLRDILQRSREQNRASGLTGALLFDGERFVQLLEGPRSEVLGLMGQISVDPRHCDVAPVYEAAAVPPLRLFQRWLAGYAEADAVAAFEAGLAAGAEPALNLFITLVDGSDVD